MTEIEKVLARSKANTEALRVANRLRMPATAAIMDEYREAFGDGVRLKWAKEGNQTIGRVPDEGS